LHFAKLGIWGFRVASARRFPLRLVDVLLFGKAILVWFYLLYCIILELLFQEGKLGKVKTAFVQYLPGGFFGLFN